MAKKSDASRRNMSRSPAWSKFWPIVAGIVFFILVCLSSASTKKTVALLLSITAVAVALLRRKVLQERMGLVFFALAAVVLMDGISTFYAVSGKFALSEFLKVLIAFCLSVILLCCVPGKKDEAGENTALIFVICTALAGLVSIDLMSTHWISTPVLGFFGLFSGDYQNVSAVESGVRMHSMFDNPNVYAGFTGIGVLLCLGLIGTAQQGKQRVFRLCLLYIISLGFILAFSMGATAFIAPAFLILLALEMPERRTSQLAVMLETLLLTAVAAALISQTSFQTWHGFDPVPLLCVIAGSAGLCLLDRFLGQKLAAKAAGKGKIAVILTVCAIAALVVFSLAAYHLTGSVSLSEGQRLRRAAYPAPGDYTLEVDADRVFRLTIESQNQQETMMHTSTRLFSGRAGSDKSVTFTVPEDSLVVYFNFRAVADTNINSVSYSGTGGTGGVPLGYKLLPGFIANRLQGLFANENAIQRTVFFQDGLKLFHRNPIVGLGMGAYENGIKSVQSFFYETRYAHDHYIQAMVETGIVGLVLFAVLLFTAEATVWFGRKSHSLAPALGAAVSFMAGHAIMEVDFSYYIFLPLAFGVFSLTGLCCGDAVPKPKLSSRSKNICLAVLSVGILVYALLLGLNMRAASSVQKTRSLSNVKAAIGMDKFEWADYMLSYVNYAGTHDSSVEVLQQAELYAQKLSELDSNTIPLYLAQYYFNTGSKDRAFAMLEKYVSYVSSDPKTWQSAFELLLKVRDGSPEWQSGAERLAGLLEQWNAENMGSILLTGEAGELLESLQ